MNCASAAPVSVNRSRNQWLNRFERKGFTLNVNVKLFRRQRKLRGDQDPRELQRRGVEARRRRKQEAAKAAGQDAPPRPQSERAKRERPSDVTPSRMRHRPGGEEVPAVNRPLEASACFPLRRHSDCRWGCGLSELSRWRPAGLAPHPFWRESERAKRAWPRLRAELRSVRTGWATRNEEPALGCGW
jgi:hypothetical protein